MINVVAAVIADESGKILITQRNLKKSQGGLWEFPGGKIELNETSEDAIIRELKEELNIDVKVEGYIDEKIFNYPEKDINLIALKCNILGGNMVLNEHEDARWIDRDELTNYNFAPADMFIVKNIMKER